MTVAVAEKPPPTARTVSVSASAGAVKLPDVSIEPEPETTDQVKVGWAASGPPNWSSRAAFAGSVAPAFWTDRYGVTTRLVAVWTTLTVTVAVVVWCRVPRRRGSCSAAARRK